MPFNRLWKMQVPVYSALLIEYGYIVKNQLVLKNSSCSLDFWTSVNRQVVHQPGVRSRQPSRGSNIINTIPQSIRLRSIEFPARSQMNIRRVHPHASQFITSRSQLQHPVLSQLLHWSMACPKTTFVACSRPRTRHRSSRLQHLPY